MRQVFFLAYCGRHAQSGRRLFCDEKINDEFFSFACPTHSTRFSLAETFMAIYRHLKGLHRQKFTKEFKKIGFGVFGTDTQWKASMLALTAFRSACQLFGAENS
ncbi:hypothetical protein [Planococcus alpniumensis]|uniref:hypothetical protein n=1 Tax=Planococcus alpniumensis TaxID=2708345 RepID=UPI001B8CB331|nr:hypothetical protein [Planococcus sp. MSAK28401]